MAYWRDDVIAVNGYDEHYHGWGCEDDDLSRRLSESGLDSFKLFRIGLAYHLWHREEDRSNYKRSREYYLCRAAENDFRCADGIDKYL
jgi:predicted glycosyltransferase involved in capsule biosynthesis